MLYEACPTLSKFRTVFAAVPVLILSTLLSGCGGGGSGTSPAAMSSVSAPVSTLQDLTVNGDASLSSRAAAKGLIYGAATKSYLLADEQYSKALAAECGMLVPEAELKWNALRPTPDTYDFARADALLAYAESHNMLFRGHTLVWHEALPAWFQSTATPANAEQMLRSHISTVVGRYAGRIHSWDVVNEIIEPAYKGPDGLRTTSPWYQLLGERYIDIAFRAAAAADPNAILVYNEIWLDNDSPAADAKRTAVLNLIRKLKAAGTPIHALGIQAHLDEVMIGSNVEKLRAFIEQVTALGLKVMITEMDVRDRYLPADIATRDQVVANLYYNYLSAVLSNPSVIAVLTWGLSDRYTWNSTAYPRGDSLPVRPLPLDSGLNRKPAWNAIAKAFDNTSSR
jgi:endo-1,4-beta-xylanase